MKKLSLFTLALFVSSAFAGLNINQKASFAQLAVFKDIYSKAGNDAKLQEVKATFARKLEGLSLEDQAEAKSIFGEEKSSFIPQFVSSFVGRFSRKPKADKEVVVLAVSVDGTPDAVEVPVSDEAANASEVVKAEDKKEEVKASQMAARLKSAAKWATGIAITYGVVTAARTYKA